VTSGHSSAGEPTRERVRATIGQVGGYWRPLAAVARMQEELGELAELLPPSLSDPATTTKPDMDVVAERCASELADLWIITTALADQFLGVVAEPDSHPGLRLGDRADRVVSREGQTVSCDLLSGLLAAAGRIARIVNYYDGPKTPRSFDGWISLSDAIAEFHRALADVAYAHGVRLAAAVSAKLDAIPTLDRGRFRAGVHEPSTAASLESFRALHVADAGPNAARLWGSPTWSSESFASNVQAVVADLTSFTKAAAWERLDGYLVCGPTLTSIPSLDDWLERLLDETSERDPLAGRAAPDPVDGVDDQASGSSYGADRRFVFNGLRLSVAVYSPLYDVSAPRRPPPDAPHPPAGTHHSPAATFVLLGVERAANGHPAQ
jgi:hypothetical protein